MTNAPVRMFCWKDLFVLALEFNCLHHSLCANPLFTSLGWHWGNPLGKDALVKLSWQKPWGLTKTGRKKPLLWQWKCWKVIWGEGGLWEVAGSVKECSFCGAKVHVANLRFQQTSVQPWVFDSLFTFTKEYLQACQSLVMTVYFSPLDLIHKGVHVLPFGGSKASVECLCQMH